MKRDFVQPLPRNVGRMATIKRIQFSIAPKGGRSTMGKAYKKGTPIFHFSSSRSTGETWVFLAGEIIELGQWVYGRWHSPKKWGEQLTRKWMKMYSNG